MINALIMVAVELEYTRPAVWLVGLHRVAVGLAVTTVIEHRMQMRLILAHTFQATPSFNKKYSNQTKISKKNYKAKKKNTPTIRSTLSKLHTVTKD